MDFQTIETPRLILRKLTQETYNHIFLNYPEAEIRRLLCVTTEEEFEKEKRKHREGQSTYRSTIAFFQILNKETGEMIGGCGYHNWFFDHRRAEIGYALNREEDKRKGYMSEAVKAVIDHGFHDMDLHRIEAYVSPKNAASLRLVEKNNFRREGYLKKHYLIDGVFEDTILWALLREEYFS